jgi:DNA modification methylase
MKADLNAQSKNPKLRGISSAGISINYYQLDRLKPHPENPRKHSKRQIKQVAESIRRFGFRFPVLVDGKQRLIAGHCRVEAAKLLCMAEIPVIEAADLDEGQIRALMIADNRLTEISEWDDALLGQNFKILADLNLDFDLTITGFDYGDIERLLILGEKDVSAPEEVDISKAPQVASSGDIWQLGDHKVFCGDSTQSASYSVLLGTEQARMIFTDPPYNLPAKTIGKVCEKSHGNFAQAAGEMSGPEFRQFLSTVFGHLCDFSVPGSIHYHFMDWRHMKDILLAGEEHYSEFKNLVVWAKDRAGMGSFYRSQHELVFVFKNGKAAHRNHFQLGQHGRTRSNVWNFPSVRSHSDDFGETRDREALKLHPTIKPVKLIEEALLDCSRRHEIILDPFLGSGSTLLACENTKRRCFGIEFAPRYVDATLYRWTTLTGKEPVHTQTGKTYNQRKANTAKEKCHER